MINKWHKATKRDDIPILWVWVVIFLAVIVPPIIAHYFDMYPQVDTVKIINGEVVINERKN